MRTKTNTNDAPAPTAESDELFEMANLYPETTGLPMTIWVSPRWRARHGVRIKVDMAHGEHMDIANTAVVSVRPAPRALAGQLSPTDARAVFQWVTLNGDALVAYWDGRIDTARLIYRLKPIANGHMQ